MGYITRPLAASKLTRLYKLKYLEIAAKSASQLSHKRCSRERARACDLHALLGKFMWRQVSRPFSKALCVRVCIRQSDATVTLDAIRNIIFSPSVRHTQSPDH